MFVLKSKYRKLEQETDNLRGKVFMQETDNLRGKVFMQETEICILKELVSKAMEIRTLSKNQAECLHSCLDCYVVERPIVPSMTRTPQLLKKLTDKGYLTRVKRGLYELSFVKYESDSV